MIPAAMAGSQIFGNLIGGGGLGGMLSGLGGLGSLFSKGMPFLQGLGGLFGNQQSMKYFDQGRKDIQNLPGMQGPSNLFGDFGTAMNGQFSFNPAMDAAQRGISGTMGALFQGQGNNQFGGLDLMGMLNAVPGGNQQAMNQLSLQQSQGLFNQGQANIAAAGDQSGLYNQSLQQQREMYAPEGQRQQNQLFEDLYSRGLAQADTGSSNMFVRNFMDAQTRADQGFQDKAFERSLAQQNFLGNLGLDQIGKAFGAEGQAFGQSLSANQYNNQSLANRFSLGQGLFGLGQNAFAQNYGLGLQGAESLLGYGDFGLRGAAMPYQLQAGLLQGGGYHAQALADIAAQQANASASFFGKMFS